MPAIELDEVAYSATGFSLVALMVLLWVGMRRETHRARSGYDLN